MKPLKTIELVEVEYWTCPIPHHRHRTLAVAQACADKHSKPKKVKRQWTVDTMVDAFDFILDGATLREAGERYGVSRERIRQIFCKVRRMAIHPSRLTEPAPDDGDFYSSLAGVRKHSAFWKRQTAKMRAGLD